MPDIATIEIVPGKLTRAEAFERFKQVLAAVDLSPSDRYRIHVAGCNYASAAAQEMIEEFDTALRRNREAA